MSTPIICFGQQPNGFFPKNYFIAKINTARKLQKEIGGKIVFFYHDSDADYRETITVFTDPKTRKEVRLNFLQENKIQKKYSPLYAKKIPAGWQEQTVRYLEPLIDKNLVEIFKSVKATNAADFCLDMYKALGILDGIEIMRSGDKEFREKATDLQEFYADVEYQNEIVRAQARDGRLYLHEGGGSYLEIGEAKNIEKWQKNPGRDERFQWMQSVIGSTHYITGESEEVYLKKENFKDTIFIKRDAVENGEFANLNFK
jgi:hypothetical protein